MRPARQHARRARTTALLGLPLCLLIALTAARVVGTDEVRVDFTGVTFALESAGSTEPGWQPQPTDWRSSDAVWTLDLDGGTVSPDAPLELRVAVRNTSGTDATVVLAVVDPDPSGDDDLFGSLLVTVREGGIVLATGPAASLQATLPGTVGPHGQDVRVLDLTLTALALPEAGTTARTGVQVQLQGTSR